ncbi:hypothetical protein D9M70_646640 [compost metagenome]
MGQVNDADRALVMVPQGFAQQPPERRHARARAEQQQRPGVPVRVVVQGAAMEFPQAQLVARNQAPGAVAEQARLAAIQVKLQEVVQAGHAGQGVRPGDALLVPQQ